ncbi:hypothetical protein NK6_4509 [Bradyrhizobium diazoefficiens]|uniref:Uncharacterized protein n=1 Tax=Bradyrhizobium diazoefficiens TaxID=1355477 RepID=A0A0E4BQU8_9BRAD|nr:hypothetical protein NK6_4509 [Bradyrhizobium diazoefficiens]
MNRRASWAIAPHALAKAGIVRPGAAADGFT